MGNTTKVCPKCGHDWQDKGAAHCWQTVPTGAPPPYPHLDSCDCDHPFHRDDSIEQEIIELGKPGHRFRLGAEGVPPGFHHVVTSMGKMFGNCPIQSEGLFANHPYYFRARGSHWTLDVVAPGADPVSGENALYSRREYVGPWPAAGWMSVEDASAIVLRCADEFIDGRKRGQFKCECAECKEKGR